MTTRKRITYNSTESTSSVTDGNETISIFSVNIAPLTPASAIFVEAKAVGRTVYGDTVTVMSYGTFSINSGAVLVNQGNQLAAASGSSSLTAATGSLSDSTTSNNLDLLITGVAGYVIIWSYWIDIYTGEL